MDAAWLKSQLEKPGRSQAALARFMSGLGPHIDTSAVNRMCNGTRDIKAREATLIEMYLRGTADGPGVGDTPAEHDLGGSAFLKVEGMVEAGSWRDASSRVSGPRTIPVVSAEPIGGDTFALRVVGPSMNRSYPDGSYVIVRRWEGGALPFGKDVIVQRTRPDGLYETTVKELRQHPSGFPELWPRSTDEAHQEPVRYAEGDDISVEIIGRVVAAWRVVD